MKNFSFKTTNDEGRITKISFDDKFILETSDDHFENMSNSSILYALDKYIKLLTLIGLYMEEDKEIWDNFSVEVHNLSHIDYKLEVISKEVVLYDENDKIVDKEFILKVIKETIKNLMNISYMFTQEKLN